MQTTLYYIAGICIILITLIIFKKKIMFLLKYTIKGIIGVVSLFILNIIGQWVGVTISLSFFSVGAAVLLGLPGIAALLFINIFV